MEPADDTPDIPEVVAVEPPVVAPARPGPNIVFAVLWWLLLLAVQIGATIAAVIVVVVIVVVLRGPNGLQNAAQGPSGPLMLEVPGATFVYFFFATFATLLTGVAVVALLYRARAPRVLGLRGLSPWHGLIVVALVPPMQIISAAAMSLAAQVLPRMHGNEILYEKMSQMNWAAVVLVGCLLPGLGEELYFRGFLGRGLVARHGAVLGTCLTAALFGALHLDPPQVVGTAVMGLVLHNAYLTTKSLLGSALLHGLNNLLAFGLMRLSADPAVARLTGDQDTPVPPMLALAALAACLALSGLLYATRTRWLLPDGRTWSPGYVTAEMPPANLGAQARITSPHPGVVAAAAAAYLAFAAALVWELRDGWQ